MPEQEISEDIQDAQVEREVRRLKQVDDKLVASYEVREKGENDMYEYTDYEKIFDTFEDFTAYTQDFFKLES